MSKRDEERGRFIERLRAEGVPEHVTRLVMRHAATLQRLAEAQCNGDWPADNGEAPTRECATCGTFWRLEAFLRDGPYRAVCHFQECGWEAPETKVESHALRDENEHPIHDGRSTTHVRTAARCPDCRTSDRVKALLAPYKVEPIFNGDPRGAVVKLKVPSGKSDSWGGEGLCVP